MSNRLLVESNIAKAETLSKEFYLSKELFEKSKEKVFASSWQFLGDESMVSEKGSAYPVTVLKDFLDEPLVLTKDKEGHINLLSNVCTHRGNIIVEKPCKINNLRCGYHGRQFHTDGKFLSMPEFKEVENFPSSKDDLTNLPLYRWGKWLFASLNKSFAPDLFLSEMISRLSWLPMVDFVFRSDLSKDYFVDAHWALYCENYLEGFHIPFVHPGLNNVIDYGNYTTELFRYSCLQTGIAKEDDNCFNLPVSSVDYGKKIAAYYFWVFPNTMFNFYPWGVSVNVVTPISTNRSKISFLVYMYNESLFSKGAGADLHGVEMEDEAIVQNVQKGIHSRFYSHGRYSVTREQGTHHFHKLITEFMK